MARFFLRGYQHRMRGTLSAVYMDGFAGYPGRQHERLDDQSRPDVHVAVA